MLVLEFDETLLTFNVNAPSIELLSALPLTIASSEVPPFLLTYYSIVIQLSCPYGQG
jgi:hypothetical protein